eukprot:238106-Prymnesium_polylepis.1
MKREATVSETADKCCLCSQTMESRRYPLGMPLPICDSHSSPKSRAAHSRRRTSSQSRIMLRTA